MDKKRVNTVVTLLVPLLVVLAAWFIVRQPPVWNPPPEPPQQPMPDAMPPPAEPPILDRRGVAELWVRLAALDEGGQQGSLQLASRLVPGGYDQIVYPAYVEFAEKEKISRAFLADAFNHYDHQYWQDAFFFKELARELTRDSVKPLQTLVQAVHQHLAATEKDTEDDQYPRPREVWQRGWGICDRQSWVLAELLYQLGYETQIVYLRRADGASPHTIVEVRRENKVWLADPLSNQLTPRSVEGLAAAPEELAAFWPDKPVWQAALANSILYTPAYPQDYCWRNQELARRLNSQLARDELPRFGEDPLLRQKRFLALRKAELGAAMRCNMMVWDFPFRPLLEDIRNGKHKQSNAKGYEDNP